MEKNKKIILIFILISASTIAVLGSTFAYFKWRSTNEQKTNVSFTVTQGFSCSGDGGGNITSNDVKLAPTTCTDSTYAIKRTVKFNTTINDGNPVYLNAWLKVNSIDIGLANNNNFKYALTTSDQGCTQGTVIASGTFNEDAVDSTFYLLENKQYLTTTTNDTYYLYIWLDEAETNISSGGQSFNISLGGECSNNTMTIPTPQPKLINVIKTGAVMDNINSAYVQNTTPGINFSITSSDTNGKGIYIRTGTQNDASPIYYYRGAVDNNNVLFAGFCWKIVRTTSTGGIKLLYNGSPTADNKCTNTTGAATHLANTSAFNSNDPQSLADVGYMYGARYATASATGTGWYYAPDVTYSNGTYTLVAKNGYNVVKKSTISGSNLQYHHYTCGSTTATTCASVRYVYSVSERTAFYIAFTNGKKVENALDIMLTNSTNTTSSTIKMTIDTWYRNNMTTYTSKFENTPWCNARSIYQLGGWDPDGGNGSILLGFTRTSFQNGYSMLTTLPYLTCNQNDAFTLPGNSNGNGKLTYPVGLITADELQLAGGTNGSNNTYYLYTSQSWWLGSPATDSKVWAMQTDGSLVDLSASSVIGVRPSVSLKFNTIYGGGDGTANNPYVVE